MESKKEEIAGVTLSQVSREDESKHVIWDGPLEEIPFPEEEEANERPEGVGGKVEAALDIGKTVVEFLKDNSGYDVAASSTYLLHQNDTNGLDYRPSEDWRSPASKWRDWKVAFWGTAGAIPLAGFQFYFDVTNQAVPADAARQQGVPVGYYIPNITITPHAIVAAPGYWMSGNIHFSNPTATTVKVGGTDYLLPKVKFSLSVRCNRFGIVKNTKVWAFELAGNSKKVVSQL